MAAITATVARGAEFNIKREAGKRSVKGERFEGEAQGIWIEPGQFAHANSDLDRPGAGPAADLGGHSVKDRIGDA
ncbi:MAG: hypothetical protein ABSD39_04900 [Terriglobales bacterium]